MKYLNCIPKGSSHPRLETKDEESEIALSIIWQASKFSAAYYEFDRKKLYLMYYQLETTPSFIIFKFLLKQIQSQYMISSILN